MNPAEFQNLPASLRRTLSAEVFSEMIRQDSRPKGLCFGCGNFHPEDELSIVTDDGRKVCPRCIFLIALYHQCGIHKKLKEGCLKPEIINSNFRKILEEEFYVNPTACYEKYLPEMIAEGETMQKIIRVDDQTLAHIEDGGFPFYLMSVKDANRFHPEPGKPITLRTKSRDLTRKVYATHRMDKKHAKKYGAKCDVLVCFIPEEEKEK